MIANSAAVGTQMILLECCCMSAPKLIVFVGPTASGKSDLALKVAKRVGGEIVQADSRTIYRKMNIGTAKPEGEMRHAADVSLEEVQQEGIHAKHPLVDIRDLFVEKPLAVEGIPHWGIDLVNPDEEFSVAQFKTYAENVIFGILDREHVPILAGGTGLYISAVVDNLLFSDSQPNIELRKELDDLTNQQLEEYLRAEDPEAADIIDVHNRRRLLRAVEVIKSTGKKMMNRKRKGDPKFNCLMVGIDLEREELYERIDLRVDQMIAAGFVDEVRALKEEYGCEVNSMTGIGYRQICAFLDGYMKLNEAIELMKRDSRHYAKRQLTWFRRDARIKWIETPEQAQLLVSEFLGS